MEKHEVIEAIHQAIDERSIIPESHKEHHAYIQMCIDRESRRREMWDKIKAQVLGWGIVAAIGFIGHAVWDYLQHHVQK